MLSFNLELIVGIILAIVGVILAIVLVLILTKNKKNKPKKQIIDEEFVSNLITILGGMSNILDYSIENARVKFVVGKVDTVNLDALKELSPKGVFVTGNKIKTLFKYESKDIIKMLDKVLG